MYVHIDEFNKLKKRVTELEELLEVKKDAQKPSKVNDVCSSGYSQKQKDEQSADDSSSRSDNRSEIAKIFASYGIKVDGVRKQNEREKAITALACEIGDNFHHMKDIMRHIRVSYSGPRGRVVRVHTSQKHANYSHKQRKVVLSILHKLSEYALIQKVVEKNNVNKSIEVHLLRRNGFTNFFVGGWYERYVCERIVTGFINRHLKFSWLKNVYVTFANDVKKELDFVLLVNDRLYIFEVKVGQYQKYVQVYKELAQDMKLDSDQMNFIILEGQGVKFKKMSAMHGITVADITLLDKIVEKIVAKSK